MMTVTICFLYHNLSSTGIFLVELEPRRQRNEQLDVLLDLVATIEDHEEVCPLY